MIEMPQRAVTRFFVPLIDVLILLFCIFLLLPFVSTPADPLAASAASPDDLRTRLEKAEQELALEKKRTAGLMDELQKPAEKTKVVVLSVNGTSGLISHQRADGTTVPLRTAVQAAAFIQAAERGPGVGAVKYFFLMPADEKRNYPDADTDANIRGWFAGKSVVRHDPLNPAQQ